MYKCLNVPIVLVYVDVCVFACLGICGLVPECSDCGVKCECVYLNMYTCLFECIA